MTSGSCRIVIGYIIIFVPVSVFFFLPQASSPLIASRTGLNGHPAIPKRSLRAAAAPANKHFQHSLQPQPAQGMNILHTSLGKGLTINRGSPKDRPSQVGQASAAPAQAGFPGILVLTDRCR